MLTGDFEGVLGECNQDKFIYINSQEYFNNSIGCIENDISLTIYDTEIDLNDCYKFEFLISDNYINSPISSISRFGNPNCEGQEIPIVAYLIVMVFTIIFLVMKLMVPGLHI